MPRDVEAFRCDIPHTGGAAMTTKTLDELAHELYLLDLNGLDEMQVLEKMSGVIGHLGHDEAVKVIAVTAQMRERDIEIEANELEFFRRLRRLAAATGCPKNAKVIPWLVERGLVRFDGKAYVLTDKAKGLRAVADDDGGAA
jgi:hypothetical protein